MLDELRELYQEVILDHGRHPRNFRQAANANRQALGNNPMCGDILTVYLSVDEAGIIQDAAFRGHGCAISMASASMMTEVLKGKSVRDAARLFESFHRMCTGDEAAAEQAEAADPEALDRLVVLSGVRQFPVRVKCATLAWHTMNAAMQGLDSVSTE